MNVAFPTAKRPPVSSDLVLYVDRGCSQRRPHFLASLIKFNFCVDDSDSSQRHPLLCEDMKHDGLGHLEGGGDVRSLIRATPSWPVY